MLPPDCNADSGVTAEFVCLKNVRNITSIIIIIKTACLTADRKHDSYGDTVPVIKYKDIALSNAERSTTGY